MWNRALPVSIAVSCVVLLSSACGGGAPPAPPAEVPAGAPYMDQRALKFKPSELTARAGEKVYFHNGESALHTVTINGKNESGSMRRNDLYVWTPPAAGEYRITCDFHPQMKATVTVNP